MTARILALPALVALVLMTPTPAGAHRTIVAPRTLVDVELVCEGHTCDEVRHRGQRYVVGDYGRRYTIALSNRSDGWVEVVVSVDGRSVTDGRRASSAGRGYLIPPRDRIELEGWRVSSTEVAAFRFTSVGDSYAGRMGDAELTGTIRVDVYPERRRPTVWVPPPEPRHFHDESERARPSADAPTKSEQGGSRHGESRWRDDDGQNLGTQYGESRWQPVEQRDFERADSRPTQTLALRYDDRRGLAERGVIGGRERDDRWVPPPPPLRIDD